MKTVTINGNKYEIKGYAKDGLPIIKATAESIHEGFDKDGFPKISTKINIPVAAVGAEPGKNGE